MAFYTNVYFESELVTSDTNNVYLDDIVLLSFPWNYAVGVVDYCGTSPGVQIVDLYSDNGIFNFISTILNFFLSYGSLCV